MYFLRCISFFSLILKGQVVTGQPTHSQPSGFNQVAYAQGTNIVKQPHNAGYGPPQPPGLNLVFDVMVALKGDDVIINIILKIIFAIKMTKKQAS